MTSTHGDVLTHPRAPSADDEPTPDPPPPEPSQEERLRAACLPQRDDAWLCCTLCGAWTVLGMLMCPPCYPCLEPFAWIVAETGGECFKGGSKGFPDLDC